MLLKVHSSNQLVRTEKDQLKDNYNSRLEQVAKELDLAKWGGHWARLPVKFRRSMV